MYAHQEAVIRIEISLTLERKGQIFFLPYIALKGWFIFYFCYTVGLCWLSILNVAMCTRSKS